LLVALEILEEDLDVPMVRAVSLSELQRVLVVACLAADLDGSLHVKVQIGFLGEII